VLSKKKFQVFDNEIFFKAKGNPNERKLFFQKMLFMKKVQNNQYKIKCLILEIEIYMKNAKPHPNQKMIHKMRNKMRKIQLNELNFSFMSMRK
jgi:hypothetical protein